MRLFLLALALVACGSPAPVVSDAGARVNSRFKTQSSTDAAPLVPTPEPMGADVANRATWTSNASVLGLTTTSAKLSADLVLGGTYLVYADASNSDLAYWLQGGPFVVAIGVNDAGASSIPIPPGTSMGPFHVNATGYNGDARVAAIMRTGTGKLWVVRVK